MLVRNRPSIEPRWSRRISTGSLSSSRSPVSARRPGVKARHERLDRTAVVGPHSLFGRFAPEALAEAVARGVGHGGPEPSFDRTDMVEEDLDRFALLVEKPGLGEKGEKRPRLGEDLVELAQLCHHLGRIELEVDLAQITTCPSGEVAVDVSPLVVEEALRKIGIESTITTYGPHGEAPLQLGVRRLVLLIVLRLPSRRGVLHRPIFVDRRSLALPHPRNEQESQLSPGSQSAVTDVGSGPTVTSSEPGWDGAVGCCPSAQPGLGEGDGPAPTGRGAGTRP